jgi:hypothetical protein
MQSICDHLLFEQAKGRRNLQRVKFIWTDRDPVLMQEATVVRRFMQNEQQLDVPSTVVTTEFETSPTDSTDECNNFSLFSQLFALLPPGNATDEEIDELYQSLDAAMERDAEKLNLTPGIEPAEGRVAVDTIHDHALETSVAETSDPWHIDEMSSQKLRELFDLQLYITEDHVGENNNLPNARTGRPDLNQIFLDMKEEAKATHEQRVAVCVCAPRRLSAICRKACIVYSDEEVRFDYHSQSMEL